MEYNLAAYNYAWRIRYEAQDGKSTDALAAGTLANQTYTFTFVDMIGKAVISPNLSFLGVEIGFEVFNFEYFLCDCRSPRFLYIDY